jgi:uncharacterized protein YegP (UPF0339 family)
MAGKFEVKAAAGGKFMFNLKAGNGQVILTSQRYADKRGALSGAESVRKHAASDANFERRTAKDDSPYFVLIASNKQEIGRSEMYNSKEAMENGIASVKKNAADAKVVEI